MSVDSVKLHSLPPPLPPPNPGPPHTSTVAAINTLALKRKKKKGRPSRMGVGGWAPERIRGSTTFFLDQFWSSFLLGGGGPKKNWGGISRLFFSISFYFKNSNWYDDPTPFKYHAVLSEIPQIVSGKGKKTKQLTDNSAHYRATRSQRLNIIYKWGGKQQKKPNKFVMRKKKKFVTRGKTDKHIQIYNIYS